MQPSRSGASMRQRGSNTLTLMLLMLGLAGMLGLIEVGYIYWVKRDLQKVVDLAAIAGVQRLEGCNAALNDNPAARTNALTDNGFKGTLAIRCGYWDANQSHVVSTPASLQAVDAIQIDGSKPAIPFFGKVKNMPMLRARAIARRGTPLATFSVGSRLLNISGNGPVQGLLRQIGLDLTNTEIASFRGLANVSITPRGLLKELGIPVTANISAGELNTLLAARQVTVGQLVDAAASIGAQQGVANVNVSALKTKLATLGIQNLLVRLGSENNNSGLFAGIAAGTSAASALDARVNALNLVDTTLQIANGSNAVTVPGLSLLGGVQAKLSVVSPPSIGIGPVGTTAYNSQVRLQININTDNIPLVSTALKLLGIQIKLPIYIDVVDGFGRLAKVDCSSTPHKAKVDVTSSVANICIGKATVPWNSTRDLCTTGVQNEDLIIVLGKKVLTNRIVLSALSAQDSLTLAVGQSGTTRPNPLALGDLTTNLVNQLLGTLESLLRPGGKASDNAKELATRYLEATKSQYGYYQPAPVIEALRHGYGDLAPIGSWNTGIPGCKWVLLVCIPETVQGDVWEGFRIESGISDSSVIGGLLDVLGLTSCSGIITGLLAYNPCIRNALAKYLETKPGGLDGLGTYQPSTGAGNCSGVLCTILKPLINATLRPLLNGVGQLISTLLSQVLGIELGQSVVQMHDIQCGSAEMVY